jgi:HK97 family phage major capsid protein
MVSQQYKRYSDEADRLSQGTPTTQTRERLKFLLSSMATMREFNMHEEHNQDEHRAAKHEVAFARYLRTGDSSELRTYTPLSTVGVPVPQGFLAAYVERLKSFSGIRAAGANVISTQDGHQLKNPFSDDTANNGVRLNENDVTPLANPTFNDTVFEAFKYSSQGLQFSAALLQDSGIDVTAYLQNIFAKRIGRITNSEFTNGGSGGPTGVIPSITGVQTSASPTAVTVAEIVGLQALDEGYLDGSVYMFSPAVERTLRAMTTSAGLPVFPEMRTGEVLCGYPYVLNVDMPTALAANAKAIVFGNFQLGVAIRDVVPVLLVSRERYAEFNMLYASMSHSQDCQVVDLNALTVLQQHS